MKQPNIRAAPPHTPVSLSATPLQPSIETFGPHRGAVTAIAVTPDASRLVSGGVDCTLVVWSIHTRTSLHIVAVREPVVLLLAAQRSPCHAKPTAHCARADSRVQPAPCAAVGHHSCAAAAAAAHAGAEGGPPPPTARASVAPSEGVTVKTAPAAQEAAEKVAPWQARPCTLHTKPLVHSVTASGWLGVKVGPGAPARATSQAAHAGAAVMPSAEAGPR